MICGSQTKPIYNLLVNKDTAFSIQSAGVLTRERQTNKDIAKMLNYYSKQGVLRNIRKGIYVKREYDPREVACLMYPPCYISLQYVLQRGGVIFQYDDTFTCVSYLSREIEIDGYVYNYRRIKPEIIINMVGIERVGNLNIATPERAFLDMYYLYPTFYFDYPDILKKDLIKEILPIYRNKNLEKRVCKLLNITDYEQGEA